MSHEYIVILPLEPMSAAVRYPPGQPLPLHSTLMHWFTPSRELGLVELNNALSLLAYEVREGEIELVSEFRDTTFGPNGDVPVHVLRRSNSLNLLHTKLLKFLCEKRSAPSALHWVGAGYRPHVADVGEKMFLPRARRKVDHMVLIERDKDKNKIFKGTFRFGSP